MKIKLQTNLWLNTIEARESLGCKKTKLFYLIKQEKLRTKMIKNKRMILSDDIITLLGEKK